MPAPIHCFVISPRSARDPRAVGLLADAHALLDYAQTDSNIVRLSMWSVARDNGNTAGAHYAAPDSSGIVQHPYDFSAILHHFDLMA